MHTGKEGKFRHDELKEKEEIKSDSEEGVEKKAKKKMKKKSSTAVKPEPAADELRQKAEEEVKAEVSDSAQNEVSQNSRKNGAVEEGKHGGDSAEVNLHCVFCNGIMIATSLAFNDRETQIWALAFFLWTRKLKLGRSPCSDTL